MLADGRPRRACAICRFAVLGVPLRPRQFQAQTVSDGTARRYTRFMHGLPSQLPLNSGELLGVAVGAFVVLTAYFLPAIIAYRRHKANRAAILAVNLFLGWTFLGWVFSLIWALKVDAIDIIAERASGEEFEWRESELSRRLRGDR